MGSFDSEPLAAFWRDLHTSKHHEPTQPLVERGRLTQVYLDPIVSRRWKEVLSWVAFHPDQLAVFVDRESQTALHHAVLFRAPAHIVEAMLYASPEVASLANDAGELALHWAIRLAAPMEIITLLVRAYPEGVFQLDETNQTNQTPMSLLWDRHEKTLTSAFPDSDREKITKSMSWKRIMLMVQAYCNLPMEKFLPLHALACCPCPTSLVRFAIDVYHDDLYLEDELGRLPMIIAASTKGTNLELFLNAYPDAASHDFRGRLPLHLALDAGHLWHDGVQALISVEPRALAARDPVTKLYPFQLAAVERRLGDVVENESDGCPSELNTVFCLLRGRPDCVCLFP